jgi:4-aminobutyrate aminotransferase-like enzyme/Ser/Thr protein kinase RdoA (MazF antagonist)
LFYSWIITTLEKLSVQLNIEMTNPFTTSTLTKAPRLKVDHAVRVASELYGLTVTAEPLTSERDQNFILQNSAARRFVLKIANSEENRDFLDLQNQLIQFLGSSNLATEVPSVIATKDGEGIATIKGENGSKHFVRLLTWLDGTCIAKIQSPSLGLLRSLGRALAEIDAALIGFDRPAAHRVFYWDLRHADMALEHSHLLPPDGRRMVESFFTEWKKIDWNQLRFSVIQNDASDYNILVRSAGPTQQRVTAILDYGDVVHTATVCELGVALAYVMLDKPDPIGAAAQVVAAYHEVYPLTEPEVDALYALVVTRLCCSVCYAAHQKLQAPENEYLNISNAPAWALLKKLSDVPSAWPRKIFRFACGLPVIKESFLHPGRTRDDLMVSRRSHLGPSLSLSYQSPLHIVCGSRQYLYDSDGRRYLDCVNNVAHVGHSHPRVVRAVSEQMAVLNTNTRYLHQNIIEYVERLTETLPQPLSVVYLVCSGSEANELALRLARAHTRGEEVIVVEGGYHGNSNALIDISSYKFDGRGGHGRPAHVHKVPLPDVYRGPHRESDAGPRYARYVGDAARESRSPAAFFCESALGCGGQIILPPGYLAEAYAAVRAAGGVCVADEVQTGFGRAGKHFWAFETQNVVPDIVTLGKPIGNGHPLGAVVTTPEIAQSFANGMEYFNTFGGNPVSCAAGLAVLDVIRDEELQNNAAEVGYYLQQGLQQLQSKHSLMGDVRGIGLFIGIELVRDTSTLEPAGQEAARLVERMKDRGVLLSTDGPLHNVIKIKPPLIFSKAAADFLLSQLKVVLREEFTSTGR